MSSAPGSDFRKPSSQMIDSMSRWLVGSSISSTSGRPSSTRAIATRIFQPPESAPTSPSIRSSSKPRPCSTSRAWPRAHSRRDGRTLPALRRSARGSRSMSSACAGSAIACCSASSSWCRSPTRPLPANRLVEHRAAGHLLDVLPEVADRQLLRHRHVPVVRHLLADDHPEERRLAGAVRPDEADLLARIELERGVDEENLPAVLLADARKRDHVTEHDGPVTAVPSITSGDQ